MKIHVEIHLENRVEIEVKIHEACVAIMWKLM